MPHIPVTIITGFLGSGKTSLVNHLLKHKHGQRLAVIENEFGEVSIDDALIVNAEDGIIEISNGCVCCTMKGDLLRTLEKLIHRIDKFDGIIVETTGLASPGVLINMLMVEASLKEYMKLNNVVTTVDAVHFTEQLENTDINDKVVQQVAFADVLLVNKLDLLPDEASRSKLIGAIQGINGTSEIVQCYRSDAHIEKVMKLNCFDASAQLNSISCLQQNDESKLLHSINVSSVGIALEGYCNINKVNKWLGELLLTQGKDIYRCKGILNIAESGDRFAFQGVHMLLDCGTIQGAASTKDRTDDALVNKVVFIGKNLDRESLLSGFTSCITSNAN